MYRVIVLTIFALLVSQCGGNKVAELLPRKVINLSLRLVLPIHDTWEV